MVKKFAEVVDHVGNSKQFITAVVKVVQKLRRAALRSIYFLFFIT